MKTSFSISELEDLEVPAKYIIEKSKNLPIILLIGEMGVGKTTLVKQIMSELGEKETSSPTFSLVNRYDSSDGPWFHFDLYRIQELEELMDLGFEEYLDSGNPCLIEWPQIATDLIYPPYLKVQISMDEDSRSIEINEVLSEEG